LVTPKAEQSVYVGNNLFINFKSFYMLTPVIKLLKDSSFQIWLLSFYVFIWFLQIGNRIGILGAIRIEFLVGIILVALSIRELTSSKNRSDVFHKDFVKSIYILYFIFFLYTFFSYDKNHSSEIFFDRILKFSMFTLFIGTMVKTKAEAALVLLGFMLAIAKIVQEGIFGVVTGGMVWQNQGIPRLHGVTKLYRHPNSLSGLAVSALPFFLFLFPFQSRLVKLLFLGAIAGLLMVVMYTGSRTGYVATLILLFAILLRLGLFKFKTILSVILILVIGIILIPQDYKDRFGTMFKSDEDRGSSATKRIEILEDAWAIVKKYPLGVGVQAFPHVRDIEFGRQQDTHNLYLEILTNLGPIGFIAFWFFIILLFKTNRRSRKILLEKRQYFLAELCYIINLYILCRLALGLFGMDLYEVYWWFAAGFTIALAKFAVTSESLPPVEIRKS
jgi:putative inorganic carbon (hco3(-)) transporter